MEISEIIGITLLVLWAFMTAMGSQPGKNR